MKIRKKCHELALSSPKASKQLVLICLYCMTFNSDRFYCITFMNVTFNVSMLLITHNTESRVIMVTSKTFNEPVHDSYPVLFLLLFVLQQWDLPGKPRQLG